MSPRGSRQYQAPTVCSKAAAFVTAFSQANGGIYKEATGGRGSGGLSTYNTAICMIALHAYDQYTYAPIILRAREYMASSQLVGDSNNAGLESMIYAQVDRTDPRVRSALDWATRHWSVDENPGMGTKGLFYYYNIMSKALSLSGRETLRGDDGTVIPWKEELIKKLVATQRPDGSWLNKNNQFWEGDAVLVTSYSILVLEYVLGL